jgi:hypothetical protein
VLSAFVSVYYLLRVFFHLGRGVSGSVSVSVARQTVRKIVFYPAVIVFCWSASLVVDVYLTVCPSFSATSPSFPAVNLLCSLSAASQGLLLSSYFYANNPIVRQRIYATLLNIKHTTDNATGTLCYYSIKPCPPCPGPPTACLCPCPCPWQHCSSGASASASPGGNEINRKLDKEKESSSQGEGEEERSRWWSRVEDEIDFIPASSSFSKLNRFTWFMSFFPVVERPSFVGNRYFGSSNEFIEPNFAISISPITRNDSKNNELERSNSDRSWSFDNK